MMIFVGAPQNGTILRELIEEQNHLFRHIPVTDNKIDTTEVNQHKSDYVIVDLCCFDDLSFMQLENLLLAINSEIILYATGYTMQSSLINKLSMNGFDLFLLAPPYSEELKEELHVILHGTDFILKDEEAAHVKAQTCISTTRNQKKGVKIGIAGVTSRMGTTTTSLQLIRYLQRMGYKACYIEVNYTKFVQEQIRFEQPLHDAHLGMATIDRMDLFYRKEMLNDVLKKDYDFFVYDYGSADDKLFNRTSFLEKDIRVFVAGIKPNEYEKTYDILCDEYFKEDVFFVFNFVLDKYKEQILEGMASKRDYTFFGVYAPSYFDYIENSAYETMLPLERIEVYEDPKPGMFGRFFGDRR